MPAFHQAYQHVVDVEEEHLALHGGAACGVEVQVYHWKICSDLLKRLCCLTHFETILTRVSLVKISFIVNLFSHFFPTEMPTNGRKLAEVSCHSMTNGARPRSGFTKP